MSLGIVPHEPLECFCEGKVQFSIDGEKAPSVGSTGLEDYFGASYTWGKVRSPMGIGKYNSFSSQYMGFRYIPDKEAPKFTMYRFHIPDPIPFRQSMRVTIQSMDITADKHDEGQFKVVRAIPRHDDYKAVVYWYAGR